MRSSIPLGLLAAGLFAVVPTLAQAQQSGMAGMHAQHVVKGKQCFTDHAHVGTGTHATTKKAAIEAAARDWSAFTAFEYGSDWGHWRYAWDKKIECEAGKSWICEVQAKPCLVGRGRRYSRK